MTTPEDPTELDDQSSQTPAEQPHIPNDKEISEFVSHNRGLFLAEGLILTILGLLSVALPQLFTFAIELLIGWLFIIAGIVQGARSILMRKAFDFSIKIASALIYLIIGVLLVAFPLKGIMTLTIMLTGLYFIQGIVQIVLGMRYKNFKRSNWLIVSGIITLCLAIIIWKGLPDAATWVLGLLAGINLIFFGISLIAIAFAVNKKI